MDSFSRQVEIGGHRLLLNSLLDSVDFRVQSSFTRWLVFNKTRTARIARDLCRRIDSSFIKNGVQTLSVWA